MAPCPQRSASSISVTGPSLTSATPMQAPKTPFVAAEPLAEAVVERLGHLARGGLDVARPVAAAGIAVEGELADAEHLAVARAARSSAPRRRRRSRSARTLSASRSASLAVVDRDAEQDQQPGPDLRDPLALDVDRRLADPLDQRPHGGERLPEGGLERRRLAARRGRRSRAPPTRGPRGSPGSSPRRSQPEPSASAGDGVEQLLLGQLLGAAGVGRDQPPARPARRRGEGPKRETKTCTSSNLRLAELDLETGPQPPEPVAELRPGELGELRRRDPEQRRSRPGSRGWGRSSPASTRRAPAAAPRRRRSRGGGRSGPGPRGRPPSSKWANLALQRLAAMPLEPIASSG